MRVYCREGTPDQRGEVQTLVQTLLSDELGVMEPVQAVLPAEGGGAIFAGGGAETGCVVKSIPKGPVIPEAKVVASMLYDPGSRVVVILDCRFPPPSSSEATTAPVFPVPRKR